VLKRSLSERGISVMEVAAFATLQEAESFLDGIFELCNHLCLDVNRNDKSALVIVEPLELHTFYFTCNTEDAFRLCNR
jgi:hypothetical protein